MWEKIKLLILSFVVLTVSKSSAQTYTLNAASNGTTVSTCGGTFYDSGGNGSNYGSNENYTITFCATGGQCLQATFNSFNTQSGNDVLTVYNGSNTSAPVIGVFSGNTVPGAITASAGCLTFKFVSNNNQNRAGWNITLSCVACGTIFNMTNGTQNLCSGLFYDGGGSGSNYSNNSNIVESFCSSNSTCIQVVFTAFNTQTNKDTLTVFDGPNTSSTRIGVFSGNSLPPMLVASSGCLTFRFKSDGSTNNSGWAAILSCVTCPTSPSGTADYTQPTVGLAGSNNGAVLVNTCGATFADDGGIGANYSNSVPNVYRTFCPSTSGMALRATFWSYSTESGKDYLAILNGATQNSPQFGSGSTWSGTAASYAACMAAGLGPYVSTDQSGCLTFRFSSNSNTTSSGWTATLDCVPYAAGPNGTDNNDCSRATLVCTNQSITDASTGPGISADNSNGCIPAESYTNWYTISVSAAGKLGFVLSPVTNTDDYDFAFFGPNPNCGSLGSPLRCSYAANASTYPNTGMSSSLNASTNTAASGSNAGSDFSEDPTGNGYTDEVNVSVGETYLLMISKWNPGGNGFALNWVLSNGASITCSAPLPVELLMFNAEPVEKTVDLNWLTASEINNAYFEIERSSDGKNFSTIGRVVGSGTSTTMNSYNSVDYEPLMGLSYYRLKQVDYDGKTTYSDIVPVKFATSKSLLTIQPNPAVNEVEVISFVGKNSTAVLKITDSYGHTVIEYPWEEHDGLNRLQINVADLAKGIYFVTLENGPEISKIRLVKE
ncbi:MAG: CUB domain-containing protein [Bacteroidia bacterium]